HDYPSQGNLQGARACPGDLGTGRGRAAGGPGLAEKIASRSAIGALSLVGLSSRLGVYVLRLSTDLLRSLHPLASMNLRRRGGSCGEYRLSRGFATADTVSNTDPAVGAAC